MSRHNQSEIDALFSAMTGEAGQPEVLLTAVAQAPEGKLLAESTVKPLMEAHEYFNKAHKAGMHLALPKLKDLHAKAQKLVAHHSAHYTAANSIRDQSLPATTQAKIHHGAELHKYSHIKNGLAQALKDRGEAHVTEASEINVIKAHAGAGDFRTMVQHGSGTGSIIGHIDRIPHVNLDTMQHEPQYDRYHAYGHVPSKFNGNKLIPGKTKRLSDHASHDEALSAIKKFHNIDECMGGY